MPTIESIISRGYFPKELPPPFTSQIYGSFLSANRAALPSSFNTHNISVAKLAMHNLARSGSLRRKLGIPNAICFYQLASCVEKNWQELQRYASQSSLSLTKPVDVSSKRAIDRQFNLKERPVRRADLRSTSRYILQTDISRFYPSIYTHSISWAIHTKALAKANRRDNNLLGNKLDHIIRKAQDDQTLGIPIGPDTSLLIAEIILSAVDAEVSQRKISHGFRYIDDYELGFKTSSDAESALANLQEILNDYELALNPTKTIIMKLPFPLETLAISELRTFSFGDTSIGQQYDILRYFDRAFVHANENPKENILKYAISRLSGEEIHSSNWALVENLLLQSIMAESGTLQLALNQIFRYRDMNYSINRDHVGQVLNDVIRQHAPLGHGSEVAWALWGLIVFKLPIEIDCAQLAARMNDSIVAILLLDANSKSLVSSGQSFSNIQSLMTQEELYGEHWLLSYEANIKNWLPSVGTGDHIASDDSFVVLKRHGVYFYDDTLSERIGYTPPEGWVESY